ncbi:low molecular weight protein-tyrosine-phosphatase [Corynebacterium sp. CCM 9204]|uniref:low molecular weight protein-tyrosine-phosphatase n=1 Tax=Corynebacterium sp. CCM 9204 TaxID=3057616 RepID=UPI003525CBFD
MSGTSRVRERTEDVYIVFVCTGNICRSPMAEIMTRDAVEDAGLTERVLIRSCGMGGWHVGQPADERAVAELEASGHDGSTHRASQFGDGHRDADLLIALDSGHVRELRNAGVPGERIRLLRSFDPTSGDDDCADPYYGTSADFTVVREQIDAALPGLINWVRETCTDMSGR